MKNVYLMVALTVLFFILSFDVLFPTNMFLDITLVLVYLLLVAQFALSLKSNVEEGKAEYVLCEKKTAYFLPMTIMPFLGIAYSYGYLILIINILVIALLYIYVFISMKRNNITVTKDSIAVIYLNNKKDSMLFNEVEKVEFNWVYNYIGLINKEGNKLILDITLKDFVVVIKAIKLNLPDDMSSLAFKRLSKFYKVFLLESNIQHLK